MIPIGSLQKPLLEYIVLLLKAHNVDDIVLLTGYKHRQIENYFGNGSRFEVSIKYVIDKEQFKGTGWALLNAYKAEVFEGFDHILVYYGDILSNIDLRRMIEEHVASEAYATLAVSEGYQLPIGVVELEGSKVIDVKEKPWINIPVAIGIMLLKADALELLQRISKDFESKELDLMSHLIPSLISEGKKVQAYITRSFWYDVGSTERYEKLDNNLVDKIFKYILD